MADKYNGKYPDLESAGFHRLDQNLLVDKPPKIKFGLKYLNMNPEERAKYCEKLAATMNHAAFLIQGERNKLIEVCIVKETQIKQLTEANEQNNTLLQSEITKMNAMKQDYNEAYAKLAAQVRELESGDLN